MKETALDVLMYLFENYMEGEFSDMDNQETLRTELTAAGFPDEEVSHAFSWLDGLVAQRQQPLNLGAGNPLRLYAASEMRRINAACRGFLMYLEQLGILAPESRELVIDRVMALEEDVDLERLKWVILLVLFNQPGAEDAFAHMEDILYYEGDWLH